MFSRLIYPIWSPFARPIRMGHGELIVDCGLRIADFKVQQMKRSSYSFQLIADG